MIFCNQCGSALADGLAFCTECGAEVPVISRSEPPPTLRMNVSPGGAATAPAPVHIPTRQPEPTLISPQHSLSDPYAPTLPPAARPGSNSIKWVVGLVGSLVVLVLAITIYVSSTGRKTPATYSGSTPASASELADSLQDAIDKNRLVTSSGGDAYTFYYQLKKLDPQHRKLSEIKAVVLPQLRSMGDQVMRRRAGIQWKQLTDSDWGTTRNVYQWARDLEPGDQSLAARLSYAEAEIARLRDDKYNAERGYQSASQLDSQWALPQFSIGLLRMKKDNTIKMDNSAERGRNAMQYFQRAINLEPNWELPYMSMGTAFYLQKEFDTAADWYRRAMEMNPQWGGPHAWMGAVYEKKNQCSAAIGEYSRAIELDPNGYEFDVVETQRRIDQLRAKCSG